MVHYFFNLTMLWSMLFCVPTNAQLNNFNNREQNKFSANTSENLQLKIDERISEINPQSSNFNNLFLTQK